MARVNSPASTSSSMTGVAAVHLRIAWRAYKVHWRVFVLAVLVLFASWVSLELAVATLQRLGVALNIVLHLVFLVLLSGLMVGLHSMALQVVDGRIPTLRCLPGSLARGPSYLVALCLYSVAVAGGLMLLVVPGVYLAVRYAFFGHVLATKQASEASALGALRDAGSLSQGRWWALFGFLLVVAALNIAGAAALGLGLLISFPVALLATSSLFRTLQHRPGGSGSSP
jgi:hypothetical protein